MTWKKWMLLVVLAGVAANWLAAQAESAPASVEPLVEALDAGRDACRMEVRALEPQLLGVSTRSTLAPAAAR